LALENISLSDLVLPVVMIFRFLHLRRYLKNSIWKAGEKQFFDHPKKDYGNLLNILELKFSNQHKKNNFL